MFSLLPGWLAEIIAFVAVAGLLITVRLNLLKAKQTKIEIALLREQLKEQTDNRGDRVQIPTPEQTARILREHDLVVRSKTDRFPLLLLLLFVLGGVSTLTIPQFASSGGQTDYAEKLQSSMRTVMDQAGSVALAIPDADPEATEDQTQALRTVSLLAEMSTRSAETLIEWFQRATSRSTPPEFARLQAVLAEIQGLAQDSEMPAEERFTRMRALRAELEDLLRWLESVSQFVGEQPAAPE